MEEDIEASLKTTLCAAVAGAPENRPEGAGSETDTFLEQIRTAFPPEETDVRSYSPLALAFLGDGVYSLIIRTMVLGRGNRQAEKLHNETRELVSAKAQARIGEAVRELLTPEEAIIFRRGHNAGPEHHARSATMEEYLQATALETLCGYLYLTGQTKRFLELLREGMRRCGLSGETAGDQNKLGRI